MSYVRRRKSNRSGRRSKPYRRPKMSTYEATKFLAYKAFKGLNYLKGLINVEKHYLDTGISNADVLDTGTVSLVSGVAAGDDVNNRQGNSILGKTLFCRIAMTRVSANANPTNLIRIIIFKDLMNQGSAPTVTTVLQSAGVTSPLNVDNTSRFVVLKDKISTLSETGTSGGLSKYYLTVNDHIKFTGTSATDVFKNALYVLYLSDQSASYPKVTMSFRLGYYDN